jgi:hypothetical protein
MKSYLILTLLILLAGGSTVTAGDIELATPDLNETRQSSEPGRYLDLGQAEIDASCLSEGRTEVRGSISDARLAELIKTIRNVWPDAAVSRIIATSEVAEIWTYRGCRSDDMFSGSGMIVAMRHYKSANGEYWAPIAIDWHVS